MEPPHELPDTPSKWGAIAGIVTSGAIAIYHFFKAGKSPKIPERDETKERLDALESRVRHNEMIHERDHREVMRLLRRLCDERGIE